MASNHFDVFENPESFNLIDTLPLKTCSSCPFNPHKPIIDGQWGINIKNGVDFIFLRSRDNGLQSTMGGLGEIDFLKVLKESELSSFLLGGCTLCRPRNGAIWPSNKDERDDFKKAIECCRPNIETKLQYIIDTNILVGKQSPTVVLLGKGAIWTFFPKFEDYTVPKVVTNEPYGLDQFPGVKFLVSYDPTSSEVFFNQLKSKIFSLSMPEERKITLLKNYHRIDTIEAFDELMTTLESKEIISFDIETSGLRYQTMKKVIEKKVKGHKKRTETWDRDVIIGISFAHETKNGYYIPLYVKLKHFTLERETYLKEFLQDEDPFVLNDNTTLNDYRFWFGERLTQYVYSKIKKLLENEKIKKIAHNGKFDCGFLKVWWGINVKNFYWDTMLASHCLDENTYNSLEFHSNSYPDLLNYKKKVKSKVSKTSFEDESYADVDLNTLATYGGQDADLTLRLYYDQLKLIEKEKESKTTNLNDWINSEWMIHNFYMPLSHFYQKAEITGICFDKEFAETTYIEYRERMKVMQKNIEGVLKASSSEENPLGPYDDIEKTGRWINLNSAKQKQKLFFEDLGWPKFKETKTVKRKKGKGSTHILNNEASTDQDTLKQILEYFYEGQKEEKAIEIELIEWILEYLKKYKMITTYLKGKKLLNRLDEHGFIHYIMKLHGTVSGRLSSSPNVQNLPRRTPSITTLTGRIIQPSNIRGIFTAAPPYKLFSSDLSQAELRIMADYANDIMMLEFIKNKVDIHWIATLDLFYHSQKLIYDPKNFEMRRFRKLIKLCNFGGLYGGCFMLNTRILTNNGCKNIEDISNSDLIINQYGTFKVKNIIFNGIKDFNKYIFSDGSFIISTENHKFITENKEEIMISDVSSERLLKRFNSQIFLNELSLPKKEVLFRSQNINKEQLPKCLNSDLSRFIGYWISEGSIKQPKPPRRNYFHRINLTQGLTTNSDLCWNDMKRVSNNLFGENNTKLSINKHRRIRINKVNLSEWFMNIIGRDNLDSYSKYIPEIMKRTTKELQIEFLKAIFEGDGWLSKRGTVGYKTKSQRLIYDLQDMLNNLGFLSKVRKDKSNSYKLELLGEFNEKFLSEISFISKQDKIHRKKIHTDLIKVIDENTYSVLLMKAEYYNLSEAYDLEIEDKHYYIAENFIVHNSDRKKVSSVNEKLELGEPKIDLNLAAAHTEWFNSEFPDIQTYIRIQEDHIEEYAWIDNKFGRRRRLPDAKSKDKFLKAEAKRQGINCVDEATQCLSKRGWLNHNELILEDEILTKNIETNQLEWNKVEAIHIYDNYQGDMYLFENDENNVSALTTPNHRWLIKHTTRFSEDNLRKRDQRKEELLKKKDLLIGEVLKLKEENLNPLQISKRLNISYIKTRRMLDLTKKKSKNYRDLKPIHEYLTSEELSKIHQVKSIHLSGEYLGADSQYYSDDLIEFIGWILTDGSMSYKDNGKPNRVSLVQSFIANPEKCLRIQNLIQRLKFQHSEKLIDRAYKWRFPASTVGVLLDQIIPHKEVSMDFLLKLTKSQLSLLLEAIRLGDGQKITTVRHNHLDMFQVLIVLTGQSSNVNIQDNVGRKSYSDKFGHQEYIEKKQISYHINIHKRKYVHHRSTYGKNHFKLIKDYNGLVWCPTVKNSNIVCRRFANNKYYQYITGQSQIQGTASDIVQLAIIRINKWLEENQMKSQIIWSVHDEMDGYLYPDEEEIMKKMIPKMMCEKVFPINKIKVELESEFEVYNYRWSD